MWLFLKTTAAVSMANKQQFSLSVQMTKLDVNTVDFELCLDKLVNLKENSFQS